MPKLPNVPIGTIIGGVGATVGVGGAGYMLYNSVFSGA